MDFLIAKTKGKRGSYYKVLSDKTTFADTPIFSHVKLYDDEYKLEEDEWFVIENFKSQDYCIEFLKEDFLPTNYSYIDRGDYKKIEFLISVQDDYNLFIFQKVTPSYVYEKQKVLCFGLLDKLQNHQPTEQAILINQEGVLVIKNVPDCYYIKDSDKLYFKNLNAITSIFNGINILYREATNQEVEIFLSMGMINVAPNFGKDDVKTANRRRIKEALEKYSSFSDKQKEKIPSYLSEYCPHIYDKNTKQFNVTDENSLTDLLNVLNQRYYTTEIDGEKRLANSVTKIEV